MDFRLTDEQRALNESVRRFANQELRPIAGELDLAEKMDARLFAAAANLGLPLDAVPAAYDGYLEGTFSHLSRALRDESLAWGCAGITHQLESAVDVALALGQTAKEVQDHWFPRIVAADYARAAVLGARDGFSVKTSGKNFSLSGSETVVLLAGSAPFWFVRAASDDGHVLLLLEGKPEAAGLTPVSNTAWRACDVFDVDLKDVAVAAESVIARGEQADAIWQGFLDSVRLSIAARGVGIGQAAVSFAEGYAAERVQFGRPIGKFQSIAQMIEESQAALNAARLLVQHTAWRLDQGERISDDIRRLKSHVAKTIIRATIDAVQILGGYGFVSDYPVEKHYRDARAVEVLYGRDMLDLLIDLQTA